MNPRKLLLVLVTGVILTGCNCVNTFTTIDDGDPTTENPYFAFDKVGCEPLFDLEEDDEL